MVGLQRQGSLITRAGLLRLVAPQHRIAQIKPGIRQVLAQLKGLPPKGDRLWFTSLIESNRSKIGVRHRVGVAVGNKLFVNRFRLADTAG